MSASAHPFFTGEPGRICFIGDSITHGSFYMSEIYEFCLARTGSNVEFYNCGIAGDNAGGGLLRLEYDVFPCRPDRAVVMFGMNDINRTLYNGVEPTAEQIRMRRQRLEEYAARMTQLVLALTNWGVRTLLTTPTPYEQYAVLEAPNNVGCNEALGACADIVREIAQRFHCPLVDFHAPMTRLTRLMQQSNPSDTIVGPDRVHPAGRGILAMVYLMLTQAGESGEVASAFLNSNGRDMALENCSISNLAADNGKIAFDYQSHSLPMRMDEVYLQTDSLLPLTDDLNRQVLAVRNLAPGNYTLEVDGIITSRFSSEQLAQGVNLARLNLPKQVQAVQRLHEKNLARYEAEQKIRNIRFVEKSMRENHVDLENPDVVRNCLQKELQDCVGYDYYDYVHDMMQEYYRLKPLEPQLHLLLQQQMAECHQVAQEQRPTHHIRIY